MNRVMVAVGSFLATNGILLLITPGRYATLRKASWTPSVVDAGLDWLAAHQGRSRMAGLIVAAVGMLLVAVGVARTRPTA
jgi:hypothetical protein